MQCSCAARRSSLLRLPWGPAGTLVGLFHHALLFETIKWVRRTGSPVQETSNTGLVRVSQGLLGGIKADGIVAEFFQLFNRCLLKGGCFTDQFFRVTPALAPCLNDFLASISCCEQTGRLQFTSVDGSCLYFVGLVLN